MTSQDGRSDLRSLAERFALEVGRHAAVLTASPDDERKVLKAMNKLETAATEYLDAVLDQTGWSTGDCPCRERER